MFYSYLKSHCIYTCNVGFLYNDDPSFYRRVQKFVQFLKRNHMPFTLQKYNFSSNNYF